MLLVELLFLKKNAVKVWWIEMFALLLQCPNIHGEAAKLSHPLKDEGYFFLGRDMQPASYRNPLLFLK